MKLAEFKDHLIHHAQEHLAFVLPGGDAIPTHAHVTEVGHTRKTFLDCGGKLRRVDFCSLQVWVADDFEHRLPAGKLAAIIDKAAAILENGDLEMQVECQQGSISLFSIGDVESKDGTLVFTLLTKRTACLAMEECLPSAPVEEEKGCCAGSTCC
jgi:hypothetical protein